MSEMIERVAEALVQRRWEMWSDTSGKIYIEPLELARAAIDAMREPTEAMDLAGTHAESYRSLGLLKVRHIWRAMFDAALSE